MKKKNHYEDEKEDMKNTSENLTVGGSDPLSSWFPWPPPGEAIREGQEDPSLQSLGRSRLRDVASAWRCWLMNDKESPDWWMIKSLLIVSAGSINLYIFWSILMRFRDKDVVLAGLRDLIGRDYFPPLFYSVLMTNKYYGSFLWVNQVLRVDVY